MRIVELSNHPGQLLQDMHLQRQAAGQRAQSQYRSTLAQHRRRVQALRDQRDRARGQRRWWAWLRYGFAVWRQQSSGPRSPAAALGPADQEDER